DPYYWNTAIPHARMRNAPYVLLMGPDETARRPAHCTLGGRDVALVWRSGEAPAVYATVQRAVSGDSSFTLKRVGDVWLVRLPRFWTLRTPSTPSSRSWWRTFLPRRRSCARRPWSS